MTMPDKFFRTLNAEEEENFRQWARENWQSSLPKDFDLYHPVVRDEWLKLAADQSNEAWAEVAKLAGSAKP